MSDNSVRRVATPTPGGWTPPYSLPAAGTVVAMSATNNAMSINPGDLNDTEFNYSLFESFGGGCYVRDYSQGGAYAIGSSGGHIHPDFTSMVVFDFEDKTWKRIDNSQGTGNNASGYTRSQIDLTNGELNGFVQVPCPAHPYSNFLALPTSRGGGVKGSVMCVIHMAITTDPASNFRSHRFDLQTGVWSRYSINQMTAVGNPSYFLPECPTVYHEATGRFIQLPSEIHNTQAWPYLDSADATWKSLGSWGFPPNSGGESRMASVDESRGIVFAQRGTAALIALDLNNLSAGPRFLTVSGSLPSGENRWEKFPGDGNFYTYNGSGNSLHRLVPPASSPFTNAWTVSTVALTGASLPTDVNLTGNGTRHYSRFFYVPPIDCFAWIAGNTNDVFLCKP